MNCWIRELGAKMMPNKMMETTTCKGNFKDQGALDVMDIIEQDYIKQQANFPRILA